MQFGYTLGPDECRQASLGFRRLLPAWRREKIARAVSVAIALAALVVAALCALAWSWTAGACVLSIAGWAAGVRVLLGDRFRSTPPHGPIVIELALGDAGLAVRIDGEAHEVGWTRVTRLVDAGWALFVGIDDEQWLVVPTRVMGARDAVVGELVRQSGRPIVALS